MNILSYRVASYYYRNIARGDDVNEIRSTLLELITERERTRAWIREQGLVPPVYSVPDGKILDIIEQPLTDYQRRLVGLSYPSGYAQSSGEDM